MPCEPDTYRYRVSTCPAFCTCIAFQYMPCEHMNVCVAHEGRAQCPHVHVAAESRSCMGSAISQRVSFARQRVSSPRRVEVLNHVEFTDIVRSNGRPVTEACHHDREEVHPRRILTAATFPQQRIHSEAFGHRPQQRFRCGPRRGVCGRPEHGVEASSSATVLQGRCGRPEHRCCSVQHMVHRTVTRVTITVISSPRRC